MPHFTFQALAPGGEQISGTLDAATRRDAYRQIESRQLVPIQVAEKATENTGNQNASETREADEPAIRLKRAGHSLAALVERRGQIAFHQAEPRSVAKHLITRIDGRD